MKKAFKVTTALLIGLSSSSMYISEPVSADSKVIPSTTKIKDVNEFIDPDVIPFTMLYHFAESLAPAGYEYAFSGVTPAEPSYNNYRVVADGSPSITNETTMFVGESILENDTDTEQTLKTNSFSKTRTNTVTSAVTNGFKLGADAKASFGIPLIGSTEITLKTEYNYSNTESTTTTDSYTYGAEAQSIKVAPHSAVKVSVSLGEMAISGKTKLLGEIENRDGEIIGQFGYVKNGDPQNAVYKEVDTTWDNVYKYTINNNIPVDGYLYDSKNDIHNIAGSGVYSADYGTNFKVTISPVKGNEFTEKSFEVPASSVKKRE